MKNLTVIFGIVFLLTGCVASTPKKSATELKVDYRQTVSSWKSWQDVEKYLKSNFNFDQYRQSDIQSRLKSMKAEGLLVRHHHKFFANPRGFCGDSANFSLQALNEINPDYNARSVFIYNKMGRPHHWVTAFEVDGDIYVMDYGTGSKWNAMRGTHGPFKSLSDYKNHIKGLYLPGMEVGTVWYRDFPGGVD